MTCTASPPPWVNRHLPRAPLRLTRGGHSAVTRGSLLLTTGTASAEAWHSKATLNL